MLCYISRSPLTLTLRKTSECEVNITPLHVPSCSVGVRGDRLTGLIWYSVFSKTLTFKNKLKHGKTSSILTHALCDCAMHSSRQSKLAEWQQFLNVSK